MFGLVVVCIGLLVGCGLVLGLWVGGFLVGVGRLFGCWVGGFCFLNTCFVGFFVLLCLGCDFGLFGLVVVGGGFVGC